MICQIRGTKIRISYHVDYCILKWGETDGILILCEQDHKCVLFSRPPLFCGLPKIFLDVKED